MVGNHHLATLTFICLTGFLIVLALSFVISPAKLTPWNINFQELR